MKDERERLITILTASLEALRTTLPLNTEAVLHDLTRPEASVINIINGHVSGRKAGDALLSGPENDTGFLGLLDASKRVPSQVFSGYTTTTLSGTTLNSASTIYYSDDGVPLVAFCINVDMDVVLKLKRDLDYLLHPAARLKHQKIRWVIFRINPWMRLFRNSDLRVQKVKSISESGLFLKYMLRAFSRLKAALITSLKRWVLPGTPFTTIWIN